MATTKTKPAAELVPIEEQLDAAREERSRLGQEARAWADGVQALEAELDGIARSDPAQFGPDGQPKAKSRAAELRAEITKQTTGQKWPDILEGADQRIRNLEHELSRAMEANADTLAREEYAERGTANARKWRQIAGLIHEAASEYQASVSEQVKIAFSVSGLDGRDVWTDGAVNEAGRLADRLAEIQPPRSVSLVPLTGEGPPRVRSVNGGYIGANVALNNASEDQPERVEPV